MGAWGRHARFFFPTSDAREVCEEVVVDRWFGSDLARETVYSFGCTITMISNPAIDEEDQNCW